MEARSAGRPAGVTILGSTGSIGVSTLDVIGRHPRRFRVVALTANRNVDTLAEQCLRHRPEYAVLADADAAQCLQARLQDRMPELRVLAGIDGLVQVAGLASVSHVMAAIVGAAGLLPTLQAARCGKHVLLANKEALVMSGHLFMQAVHDHGATLLPIDSEHNAILQCLPDHYRAGTAPHGVRRVLLTASGGPFRSLPLARLAGVTPEQACAHPNWVMGRKISVDSATMMNKGLEVIEASWLFGLPQERIAVVLHPQSIIHSLVEYVDGSMLAQLGNPDMRIPISHALGWPDRIESGAQGLDLLATALLQFEPPDHARYPCLALAAAALQAGGTAPAVLNAANEVAVEAFLERRMPFPAIPRVIEETLARVTVQEAGSLENVLAADTLARQQAAELVAAGRVTVAQ
jgi:1-deoxy-D-xylulose-5-phosphate reductoisomerase